MKNHILINPKDMVAVALQELHADTEIEIEGRMVRVLEHIPAGHKFAITAIKEGDPVLKYGEPIGFAMKDIAAGEWVHVHNLKTTLSGIQNYEYAPLSHLDKADSNHTKNLDELTFMGYSRANGTVGIRNEIWIIPTVGCVNNVARAIEQSAKPYRRGNIDDIIAFSHPYGCSQLGDDQENTRKIIALLAAHPNAGGVLVLGLGCENSGVEEIKRQLGTYDEHRIRFLVAQDCEEEVEAGVGIVKELIEAAAGDERVRTDIGKLVIGLKCGGSDGLSGITANPLVGRISDQLIQNGGTSILTEVPEMFGAETILMKRCANEALFQSMVQMINGFKQYYMDSGLPVYENPSPGNKAGGISTLEDKSLGCTQKSGKSMVEGVLEYGQCVVNRGLNLLSAPGNDLIAATALAAAGAHMVLFTTGRGTPFASPVPTIKIASNQDLASHKMKWIDFDAGILTETSSFEEVQSSLMHLVLETASGKWVKSEQAGYHDMAIWKQGVTL